MPDIPHKVIRSNRRTLAVSIQPDGTVLVKAPFFTTPGRIRSFIEEHTDWIEEHIQKVKKRSQLQAKTYASGATFWYLGNQVTLSIGNYAAIHVRGDILYFPQVLEFRIKKELETWYIKKAREVITDRLEWYAKEMKLSYTDLTFSDTRSQWGRCTHDNRLQFSWRLIMAPLLTINYVVVHELAHTVEKNHSRSFWNKVRFYNPTYRQQMQWLKNHGHELVI